MKLIPPWKIEFCKLKHPDVDVGSVKFVELLYAIDFASKEAEMFKAGWAAYAKTFQKKIERLI